jgi:hypothetical protein
VRVGQARDEPGDLSCGTPEQFTALRHPRETGTVWLLVSGSLPREVTEDTCYKSIEFMSEEQQERKVEAFNMGHMTVGQPLQQRERQVARSNKLGAQGGTDGGVERASSIWSPILVAGHAAGHRSDTVLWGRW